MMDPIQIPEKTKGEEPNQEGFPGYVFHQRLQAIAKEFEKAFSFHPDHIGLGILSALASAIGARKKAILRNRHTEPSILWAVIVGNPGTAKTHVIQHLFQPFIEMENERFKAYENELETYNPEDENSKKPKYIASVLRDYTFEGLVESVRFNPQGSVIVSDEILAMTGNMNRYTKGDDESFYLSLFSGHGITTTRKTQSQTHTEQSCVNIIGGIQPDRLQELLTMRRMKNGFAYRFLFAFPDAEKKPWTNEQFNEDLGKEYANIIREIMKLDPEYPELRLDKDAWDHLRKWQNKNTETANEMTEQGNHLAGLISKWESYVGRFALILQISADICAGRDPTAIGLEAVEGAIRLFDYFLTQSEKAFGCVYHPDNPGFLEETQLKLFLALPDNFTTQTAKECGARLDPAISERSVDTYISNARVYEKVSHGNYRKRIK